MNGVTRVTVKLYITLDGKVVKEEGELEAANVAELLGELARRHGRAFRDEIYDGNGIKNYHIVLRNGRAVDRSSPGSVVLGEGDTVHIFPPVSGG